MDRKLLFEVPFYRVSFDQWYEETESRIQNWVDRFLKKDPATDPAWARAMASRHHRPEGYMYNQIVGWVRLEWDGPGPVVKRYAWKLPLKRVNRFFTKTYEEYAKVTEWWFLDESSQEIAAELRKDVMALTNRGNVFAGRHADLEAFDNLAPHIDWRDLIGLAIRGSRGSK